MQVTSYKVSDSLFLVQQDLDSAAAPKVVVEQPTDHILVIDCSGSMSWELPKIREQLKAKLPKLLKEQDTISVVWFSGRREFGVLLEGEPVATLKDLQDVNKAIDRWLKPVGLTGFKEPLEEVPALVDRLAKKRSSDGLFSLFFMSDGCDNQWPRADILKAVEKIGQKVSSATFVEYGYYADRPLLTAMAEKCGGVSIFAQDFDQYAPNFEAVLQKKVVGAPKIEVKIQGDPIGGFAYALVDGDLVTYGIENGAVKVPENVGSLWYLTPGKAYFGNQSSDLTSIAKEFLDPNASSKAQGAFGPAYAAISLFAQRMKSDVVYALLKGTGDVRFIEQFSGCFGKQKYSDFMQAAKEAAFNPKQRLTAGCDPNKVPKDDAFTVLDLLRVLSGDDENRVLLDSKDFKYSKIGRGRIDSSEVLTAEEQAEIQKLTEDMGKTKDAKKIAELTQKIAAITASKQPALKFEVTKEENGYPINSLVYNEERPNVSFSVRRSGKVDISARTQGKPELAKLPAVMDSFTYRNYTVLKDGLVNLDRLPVRLTAGTIRDLKDQGMPIETIVGVDGEDDAVTRVRAAKASDDRPVSVVFDVKSLPIINRKMVKEVSAKTLFMLDYELCKARSAQKVYNTYKKEHFPKKSEGYAEQYGKEAADWLKEQGITDYNGFNPKSVQAESTDYYMGKELKVSLKGLSSIPSLKEAKEKMVKGKLTPSVGLMAPYVKEVEDFLASDAYKNSTKKEALFEGWLDGQQKTATKKVRSLLFQRAQITFGVIVGQVWFSEFKSLDENTLTIEVDGQKIEGKVEMKEVEVRI